MWPRQRDGVTCGPSVAVMAGALLDAEYGAPLRGARPQQWFDAEQGRVHSAVNRFWPRALGTTPAAMARALTEHSAARGVRYRWRPALPGDSLTDVCAAVAAGWPVAMLIGAVIPRHWVLVTELDAAALHCYEPSAGAVVPVPLAAIRRSGIEGLGYPRALVFVVPHLAG